MDDFAHVIFEALFAFPFVLGGVVLLVLGGVCFADLIYWRVKASRSSGKIVSVRAYKGMSSQKNSGEELSLFYPVIEYRNKELGRMVEGETDSGDSFLRSKIPGRKVSVLYMQDDPETVRIPGSGGFLWGTGFLCASAGLVYKGIESVSLLGILLDLLGFLIFAAVVGLKIRRLIAAPDSQGKRQDFKERRRQRRKDKQKDSVILSKVDCLRILGQRSAYNRGPGFVLIFVGLVCIGTGIVPDLMPDSVKGLLREILIGAVPVSENQIPSLLSALSITMGIVVFWFGTRLVRLSGPRSL